VSLNAYYLATVLEAPIISEKSTTAAENFKQFVFRVKKDSNKIEIKNAVEVMFNVEVDFVRVLNVKGKEKRFGRSLGRRQDWKKAYVKLKPGFDIDFSAA